MAGSTQILRRRQGHAYVISRRSLSPCFLFEALWMCGAPRSTSRQLNCRSRMRTASEVPKGLSGSMMWLMKVETTFSGLSWSGAGGLPISASPSPASKLIEGIITRLR